MGQNMTKEALKQLKEARKQASKELRELKKRMSKSEFSKFEQSYHTYKRDWYNWKNKGWAMKTDRPLNAEDYYEDYLDAVDAQEKNIGSNFASSSRILDNKSAKELKKILDKIDRGTDASFEQELEERFNTLTKIKRNIGDYKTYVDGETYTAKQALYLDIKFIYGITAANEYYGYK
jgi:hypothetical protein